MIQITEHFIVDKGTCSSDDHCIFHSSSFLGGNYSLILQKLPRPLHFQIADFSFFQICQNVKMARKCIKALLEIKRRYVQVYRMRVFKN